MFEGTFKIDRAIAGVRAMLEWTETPERRDTLQVVLDMLVEIRETDAQN